MLWGLFGVLSVLSSADPIMHCEGGLYNSAASLLFEGDQIVFDYKGPYSIILNPFAVSIGLAVSSENPVVRMVFRRLVSPLNEKCLIDYKEPFNLLRCPLNENEISSEIEFHFKDQSIKKVSSKYSAIHLERHITEFAGGGKADFGYVKLHFMALPPSSVIQELKLPFTTITGPNGFHYCVR